MKLQDFSGGLNTRREANLLAINEAQVYENIDNESGVLKPVLTPIAASLSLTNKSYYSKANDSILTLAEVPIDALEYKGDLYYSVDNDYVQFKDDSTEGDLGLHPPSITTIETENTRPATPVIGDITFAEYDVPTWWIYNTYGFQEGKSYDFAFQRVSSTGVTSDVFEYTYAMGAGSDYKQIGITIGYEHRVFLKTAGVWRRFEGHVYQYDPSTTATDPDRFLDSDLVGEASNEYRLLELNFLLITDVEFPSAVPADSGALIYQKCYEVDIAEVISENTPAGTFSYVVTTEIVELGWESEPSPVQTITVATEVWPALTIAEVSEDIDSAGYTADTRINRLNIYRLGNTITDYTLVKQIDDPTFPVEFTDSVLDTEIAGNSLLDTTDNDKPLSGMKNLLVVNGQLCGTIGARLYFSRPGKLFGFPSTNYRDFDEDLTGLFLIDAGLLVFSLTKTWLVNTSNLGVGKSIQISEEFGCTAHLTCAGYRTGAIWHSNQGYCVSFGGKVEVITKEKLGYQNLNVTKAKVFNETYWGFADDGTCYALDLRYKNVQGVVKYFNFSIFDDSDGTTIIRQVYVDNSELKVLFGTTADTDSYTIFGGSANESIAWTSPRFTEGAYTELKTYKDVFIRASKGITVKVYLEDCGSDATQVDELVGEHIFKKLETYHMKVDYNEHQAYALYIEITGTGTVYEIEFKTLGRQNGR